MGRRKNSAPAGGVVAATTEAPVNPTPASAPAAGVEIITQASGSSAEAAAAAAAQAAAEAAAKPKKAATVRMRRDEPAHPGGPTEADVHPDEVAGWADAGWVEV